MKKSRKKRIVKVNIPKAFAHHRLRMEAIREEIRLELKSYIDARIDVLDRRPVKHYCGFVIAGDGFLWGDSIALESGKEHMFVIQPYCEVKNMKVVTTGPCRMVGATVGSKVCNPMEGSSLVCELDDCNPTQRMTITIKAWE